jgi:hypothetical protein
MAASDMGSVSQVEKLFSLGKKDPIEKGIRRFDGLLRDHEFGPTASLTSEENGLLFLSIRV